MSLLTEEEFMAMTNFYEERMAVSQLKEMYRRIERATHFDALAPKQREVYDKESEIGKIRYLIRRMELTRAYYHQLYNKGMPFKEEFMNQLKLAHTFLQNQQRLRREELKTLQQEPQASEPDQEAEEESNEPQLPLTKSAKRRLRRQRLKNQKSEETEVDPDTPDADTPANDS